ncbi:MAG TPA: copper resistance CopC family protein [Verrucomicrobiae bacterium]|nr:copper resistance CopC family protein [Verrucomicrobiae bacterium]
MKTIKRIIQHIPSRLTLAAILFFAISSRVRAHAFLDHADPKVGSTVTNAPTQIRLWFTQNPEPVFSSVEVQDVHGREVDKKDMRPDEKDKSLLIVSVPPLSDGKYKVIWHVVSVDTHRTQGHFEFTIKRK